MEHVQLTALLVNAYFAVALTGGAFGHYYVANDRSLVEDQYSFKTLGLAGVVMAGAAEVIKVVYHLDHKCFTANVTTY